MINLFINYYTISNEERQEELDYCVQKNIDNILIDNIYIFLDKRIKIPFISSKIKLINLERPTYADIINYINSKKDFRDSYNIISNTDLYFDRTLLLLDRIDMKNTCVVLNRWNVNPDGSSKFLETKGSQDVWIFKGKIKQDLSDISNFYLGKRCCDNVFLNNLYLVDYRSISPSYDIKAFHLHNVDFRTWQWGIDEIPGKHMYINLCHIEDVLEGKSIMDYYDTTTEVDQKEIRKKINLFINYYKSENKQRQEEIDKCLLKNHENPCIYRIYAFCDKNIIPKIVSEKIIYVNIERVTYSDFICYINSHIKFLNSYNIISNSDIYFDESILLLDKIDMENTCVSLTRWNVQRDGSLKFYKTKTSQDVWIFKGKIKIELENTCKFILGQQCCDNVFIHRLYTAGYRTINPCGDIKVYHLHNVNFRKWNYSNRNTGPHMYLYHCDLHEVTKDKPLKSCYDIDRPIKTNLFINYYEDENKERQKELIFCLNENMNNRRIDVVTIFSETDNIPDFVPHGDVNIIKIGRPTYESIVKYINDRPQYHDSYNIITNADIFFDNTLSILHKIDFKSKKTCLALSRHEVNKKEVIKIPSQKFTKDSQDAWIFKGNIEIKDTSTVHFNFGVPGCDNRFAFELNKNGYNLINLCYDIKIYHYHLQRPEKKGIVIPGPYTLVGASRRGFSI